MARPEKVSIPSEAVTKVSRWTASASGAPVASTPPQPPAASGPVGNGGEKRSMRSPDDWATYTRPSASTATEPAVPRSVASLQKPVDGSSVSG